MDAYYNLLYNNKLLNAHTAKKEKILEVYEEVFPYFSSFYSQHEFQRYVDFNQGIDARLITQENMTKLAEIPLRPVRIAFDSWRLRKTYEKAVKTAVSCGHKSLSNYLLYNYNDKPIDLYYRLKLNVDLCEELGATIYSFPMKYHPIDDIKYFKNRDYTGKHWNRKFIRTIQAILNATKGKVGKGKSFFEKAFGSNEEEFEKLLYMPEAMIIYRLYFESTGETEKWWKSFSCLSDNQTKEIKEIIHKNDFLNITSLTKDDDILEILEYYTIKREATELKMKSLTTTS